MYALKLVQQHHLSIDLNRFSPFTAGPKIQPLHDVGGLQGFGFEGILLRG